MYVVPVAPLISTQFLPSLSQRIQLWRVVAGAGVAQVPGVAVSLSPSVVPPLVDPDVPFETAGSEAASGQARSSTAATPVAAVPLLEPNRPPSHTWPPPTNIA